MCDYNVPKKLDKCCSPLNATWHVLCCCTVPEMCTIRYFFYLDFAVNHYGKPDVAMFDFTSMYAADHSARYRYYDSAPRHICSAAYEMR